MLNWRTDTFPMEVQDKSSCNCTKSHCLDFAVYLSFLCDPPHWLPTQFSLWLNFEHCNKESKIYFSTVNLYIYNIETLPRNNYYSFLHSIEFVFSTYALSFSFFANLLSICHIIFCSNNGSALFYHLKHGPLIIANRQFSKMCSFHKNVMGDWGF